jgi:hypothetical protein
LRGENKMPLLKTTIASVISAASVLTSDDMCANYRASDNATVINNLRTWILRSKMTTFHPVAGSTDLVFGGDLKGLRSLVKLLIDIHL